MGSMIDACIGLIDGYLQVSFAFCKNHTNSIRMVWPAMICAVGEAEEVRMDSKVL